MHSLMFADCMRQRILHDTLSSIKAGIWRKWVDKVLWSLQLLLAFCKIIFFLYLDGKLDFAVNENCTWRNTFTQINTAIIRREMQRICLSAQWADTACREKSQVSNYKKCISIIRISCLENKSVRQRMCCLYIQCIQWKFLISFVTF